MELFGNSREQRIAVKAFDRAMKTVTEQGASAIAKSELLLRVSESKPVSRFCYYAIVAALDLIHVRGIIAFGQGSRQSIKIAQALRDRFESEINEHLIHNLTGLHDFIESTNEIVKEEDPEKNVFRAFDPRGIWVLAAYEGSWSPDIFLDGEAIRDGHAVSVWIHEIVGTVF